MEPLINIVWNPKLIVLSIVFAFLFSFLEFKNVLNKRFLWSLQNWSLYALWMLNYSKMKLFKSFSVLKSKIFMVIWNWYLCISDMAFTETDKETSCLFMEL